MNWQPISTLPNKPNIPVLYWHDVMGAVKGYTGHYAQEIYTYWCEITPPECSD